MNELPSSSVVTVILAKDEELSIAEAVSGARRHCERVVVMDGHSTDLTVERARSEGAEVYEDPGKGKERRSGPACRLSRSR